MSILFGMPRWGEKSEVWMTRMIDALGDEISYIACENPPDAADGRPWEFETLKQSRFIPSRALRRMGVLSAGIEQEAMEKAARDPRVKVILVNYLPFALQYEKVWRKADKPLFVHCHGYDLTWDFRMPRVCWVPYHPPAYKARVRGLSAISTFLVNSEYSKKRLIDIGIPESRVVVRRFGVPADDVFAVREAGRKTVKILFVGRLIDCKGPDLLIRAFEWAIEMGMEAELIIAGDGPQRGECEALRQRSKYKDRISMLGPVSGDHAAALRREADIFSAHSCKGRVSNQEESLGVAFLEAMAAGLPVATGRSGGIPEYIEHGKTGILFEPGDIEAHAIVLRTLSLDPRLRETIGIAAWRYVRANMSLALERNALRALLGLNHRSEQ